MKVSVDSERCEAHGMCQTAVPEFFALDDEGYNSIGIGKPVAPGEIARVRVGVNACPVGALSIFDEE